MIPALLLGLFLLMPTPTEVLVISLPAKGKVSVSLGLKGKAEVERTGSVTLVSIRLEGIMPPPRALPGTNAYVAWAVSPEGAVDNLGELEILGDKASIAATTPFDRLGILITAEPHYMVDSPNFAVMYKNEDLRSVRSLPVSIPVGVYEYGPLPQAEPGALVPPLVMEARAALAIALAEKADRLAETEFRRAQVALDTMEDLARRASPTEVIASAAHEAIRRAQAAVTLARQSSR